jgi:hypothetical protein
MPLIVEQTPDGTYAVLRDGVIVAAGLSNAAAWREADRLDSDAQGMGRDQATDQHRRLAMVTIGPDPTWPALAPH